MSKELILNDTLEQGDIRESNKENFLKYDFHNINIVRENFTGEHLHYSFIDYVKMAYDNHKGLIIKPDFIWHTVLFELSQLIVKDPEKYRDFFTKQKEGKIAIVVPTNDSQLIDLDLIIAELHKLVPTDTEQFLLEFSTGTELSKMAINAAFCEAVSPFYDYMTFMCGLPKIKVLGTTEDWDSIKASCESLKEIFTDHVSYFNGISGLVDKFKACDDVNYLSKVFFYESEGSGGKTRIQGWIKTLFIDKKIRNYNECPKQVSKVEYKNLTTGGNFKLHCGLFSSDLDEEEYLIPEFGYVIEQL